LREILKRFPKTQRGILSLPLRSDIRPGLTVQIVEKQNQRSGAVTEGIVARILTSSPSHPHGIKVMLEDGRVGRVKAIVSADA
jgi:uncharacterized repeat protein (TIGR03833 family)